MASPAIAEAQQASRGISLDPYGSTVTSVPSPQQIVGVLRPDQQIVPGLVGTLVTHPVTVQGTGGVTAVVGNLAVTESRTPNFITVECPAAGDRIVFEGNRIINRGDIEAGASTGATGTVVVTCPYAGRATVAIDGNNFINQGTIAAH